MTTATTVKVNMEIGRITKNTIRYEEVLESELDAPKVGTLYVPKTTLRELGTEAPQRIEVEIAAA